MRQRGEHSAERQHVSNYEARSKAAYGKKDFNKARAHLFVTIGFRARHCSGGREHDAHVGRVAVATRATLLQPGAAASAVLISGAGAAGAAARSSVIIKVKLVRSGVAAGAPRAARAAGHFIR